MKKQKRDSILIILIFILLLAGGIYTVVYGLGKEKTGQAADIKWGLDLAGGVSITYKVEAENPSEEDMKDTVYRLQKRVAAINSEGEVYQMGNDRIAIEIPDVDDPEAVLTELGKPGALEFVDEDNYSKWLAGKDYETLLTGDDVADAKGGIDDSNGTKDYVCQLQFTEEGTKKFGDATTANVGKLIYIIYEDGDKERNNKDIASRATVNEAITTGNAVINGLDSFEEAEALATTIRIGALPLELSQLSSTVVGAKLGEDAIRTSLYAGAVGLVLIFLIMIVAFRVPGLIASIALCAYVILTLLALNVAGSFGIALTLPGLAGIILTVGMAVDANVIIFTRIKEEIATGASVKRSIEAGFDKAMSAILDGNITTLIAAAVLYVMGIGTIRGFAATLAIGVLISMFTALVITKHLLNAVFVLGLNKPGMYGKAKEPKKVDYVKASKYCMAASALVILTGIVFLFINKASSMGQILNFSTEFLGGTSIQASFDKEYTLKEAEEKLSPVVAESAGVSKGDIQYQIVDNTNEIVIKIPEISAEKQTAVQEALKKSFKADKFAVSNISSTVSGEMRRDAIISVLLATLMMLIYIAFRFDDVKFGASAVLALLHDVLVVFMVYSVFRLSVGNTFIACMLTIVGYSINATIIIFDRIRENKAVMSEAKDGLDGIVNSSIAQTFSRTILTSLTTFVMVLVLYIMGVASLKEFTLALMVGIVCGAYSSVCITGPLWWLLKTKLKNKKEAVSGKNSKSKKGTASKKGGKPKKKA